MVSGVEDLAARALRLAIRALPNDAAPWGRAMVAELAAIDASAERRRFALSCARAVLTCRPVVRAAVPRLALAGYGLVALLFAARVPPGPQRYGAIAVVLVLTVGCGVACGRIGFGPAGHGRLGRWFRVGGLAVIGAEVLAFLVSLSDEPGDVRLLAVVTAVFGVFVLAVVRVTAATSAITRPVLGTAVAVGMGAAAMWTVCSLVMPNVPTTNTTVLAIVAGAGIQSARLGHSRLVGRRAVPVVGLVAPAITAHVIALALATALPLWSRWIPNNAPPAFGLRLVDPIVAIVLSAVLAAFVAIVVPGRSAAPDSAAIAKVVE